jgi:hypothetical protein
MIASPSPTNLNLKLLEHNSAHLCKWALHGIQMRGLPDGRTLQHTLL